MFVAKASLGLWRDGWRFSRGILSTLDTCPRASELVSIKKNGSNGIEFYMLSINEHFHNDCGCCASYGIIMARVMK